MPKKILIVEDEANIRELLRLYLEREGYTVLEAENGVEGIKKWKSDKPDMLLLDVMMPVMDGWAHGESEAGAKRSAGRSARRAMCRSSC